MVKGRSELQMQLTATTPPVKKHFSQDRVCAARKAPVGLLSGRAVCVSRWRGFAPTSSAERVRRFSQGRLDNTRTLSVISLCSMPAPPKGELLCAAARLYHSTKRARPLRHRYAMPHSPFCRCATSSPDRGKSFLKGRGLGSTVKLLVLPRAPPLGELAR